MASLAPNQELDWVGLLKTFIEHWFTIPGAIITVVLVIALTPSLKKSIFSGRWILNWKEGRAEHTPPTVEDSEEQSTGRATHDALEEGTPSEKQTDIDDEPSELSIDNKGVNAELQLKIDMYTAAENNDPEALRKAYGELSNVADREISIENLDGLYHYLRAKMGITEAIDELKELEKNNDDWTSPSYYLALLYKSLDSYDQALMHIDTGLAKCKDSARKAVRLQFLRADIFTHLDKPGEILEDLYDLVSKATTDRGRTLIYDKLADLYEALGDRTRMRLSLEQGLRLEPENKKRRFRIAYSYADDKNTKDLAIYHYQILTIQDPKYPSALNNYGALLEHYNLHGKKILLWKQAKEFDNPYPAGNIAISLANAGFQEEAKKCIEEIPEEHRNQARAIDALKHIETTQEDQGKQLQHIEKVANLKHRYMLEAITTQENAAVKKIKATDLIGTWEMKDGMNFEIIEANGNLLRGRIITESHIYEISGEKIDALINLHFKQTKVKSAGGLFSVAPFGAPPTPTWTDTGTFRDEYDVILVLKEPKRLVGYREFSGSNITELIFDKVD